MNHLNLVQAFLWRFLDSLIFNKIELLKVLRLLKLSTDLLDPHISMRSLMVD